jgi:aminobenzoyl-glutamate utilization protein B
VKDYFATVSTKDQKYVAMLSATDRPATELNSEIMSQYKGDLKTYYYDPSRYATYLEQLQIRFPTFEKPNGGK